MNNPAPISNKNETATCRTSSPLLKRDTVPVARRLCFRAVVRSRLVARHAGANPKRKPVSNVTVSVNTNTRQLRLRSTPLGSRPVSLSVSARRTFLPQKAKTTPAAVSYTHLRAHETPEHLVCRLLLEK